MEVAAATAADFEGDTDTAYGGRVFLRHYCVHLTGPDPSAALSAFLRTPGLRAVSTATSASISGDGGRALESGTVAADLLGVRVARKTLLAVAGLVSVHDHTWTTDRSRAVRRWSELEPGLAAQLGQLLSWATARAPPLTRGSPGAHSRTMESSLRSSSASAA